MYKLVQDAARKFGAVEQGCELPRSAGQLRVAALLTLVTGIASDMRERPYRVTVNVTMDLPTLLGLRDNPAELPGYGALPPSIARGLAADAAWRRLIHEPTSGALLDLGRLRYRPSAGLADHVPTRDVSCIFPTCTRRRTDLRPRPRRAPPPRRGQAARRTVATCTPSAPSTTGSSTRPAGTLRTSDASPPVWVSPLGRHYPLGQYDYRPPDDIAFDLPAEPEAPDPEPEMPDLASLTKNARGEPPF